MANNIAQICELLVCKHRIETTLSAKGIALAHHHEVIGWTLRALTDNGGLDISTATDRIIATFDDRSDCVS